MVGWLVGGVSGLVYQETETNPGSDRESVYGMLLCLLAYYRLPICVGKPFFLWESTVLLYVCIV